MDSYSRSSSPTGASIATVFLLAGAMAITMAALALVLIQQRRLLKESRQHLVESSDRRETELKRLGEDIATREAQLKRFATGREMREAQLQRMVDTRTKGEAAMKELATARVQREAAVKQSGDLQKKFQELVLDLLLLSKTDADAKAITEKYNIQQNLPPAEGAGAPK